MKHIKVDRNAPITSKTVFPKRSAKMIKGTEKPKIPSKFAKRAARYNEFGYNVLYRYWLIIDSVHFLTEKIPGGVLPYVCLIGIGLK